MRSVIPFLVATSILIATPTFAEENQDILFRGIPWETTYAEVCEALPEMNFWELHGDGFITASPSRILKDEYEFFEFEEGGFGVNAHAFYGEHEVAGYTTSDVCAYFVLPIVDGVVVDDVNNSKFYGAQYEFEPRDVDSVSADLYNKLCQLYGESSEPKEWSDYFGGTTEYVQWESENSIVGMRTYRSDKTSDFLTDNIYISYVYKNADAMLKEADLAVKNAKNKAEEELHGNSSLNGL